MALKDLLPTKIRELFFPSKVQVGTSTAEETTGDTYNATQIDSLSFPPSRIATGVICGSLNTEARTISSNFTFQQFGAISIGTVKGKGTVLTGTGIRISPYGIYGYKAGVPTFTLNAITGDFITSGYIQVGGAAADVNAGVTWIGAGKILISGSTALSAWSAGGDATYIDGGKLYTGTVIADTVRSSWVYAGNITAGQIHSGTITIGGTDQPGELIIQHSTDSVNSRLRFEGTSRIWEDSSNNMGLHAVGGELTIYTNGTHRAFFGSSNINLYPNTVYLHSINFNFDGQTEGSIHNVDEIKGANDIRITGGGDVYFYRDGSYNPGARIQWGTGKIFSYDSNINLGGTDKLAIVPTKDGYKALYCVEAPEVWFFDFCKSKKKIDPLFLEVTEGEMRFIKCDKGYQVWRRRKGHANKRFETKTALQFIKNEAFYKIAK